MTAGAPARRTYSCGSKGAVRDLALQSFEEGHPMAGSHELKFRAAWWQQLKQLGYDVIPLYAKDAPHKGWPKMPNDAAAIRRWNGAGAAIRMRGSELLVIDLDVHVEAVRDQMLGWLTEHHPDFMASCLRRRSGAIS